ncbi:hypothetical protein HZS38_08355 [Xenorhabdus nematophila]|uniref:Uncharacterized protein n=2 Tax=Xenorhabdus nematophila TaxID=628 RepID=D3VD64_XENNA|nr:hypothetical protein D3790_08190 [Xenorhabdus nematophila]CBJ89930.1 hypothetical protein XNC1_1870 [Xenorhabdus nematophila ATCC 19061]CCW30016.1 conserved hypothetical protein [Xenorhabdus nematophila F1]CEE93146.1 hypothetical protein XNA1_3430009 [Xenorhabdus nematophila str. Anatoliense]CEK22809.1 hypothetical protein XNC2_1815 [Xenorhabdus nematophila AN6/1]
MNGFSQLIYRIQKKLQMHNRSQSADLYLPGFMLKNHLTHSAIRFSVMLRNLQHQMMLASMSMVGDSLF